MKVLKFGGTSIGTAQRMHAVADIVQNSTPKIVVLSAVAGTTDSLTEIAQKLYAKAHDEAATLVNNLEKNYSQLIDALYKSPETKKQATEMLNAHFEHIHSFTKDMFTLFEERAILAQGEMMSTALFHYYLRESGIKSVLLPALDYMRLDSNGEPDVIYIEKNLKNEINKHPKCKLFITQGYICRNAYGEIDNLKRGGSDYSATLIGAAINAEEIQIWTDIDGMHNNDPREVGNTYPIRELSFTEAAELAYFGARILHPASIRPAKDKNIPVLLRNALKPEAEGTLITAAAKGEQIKAIAAKDGIVAIKIRSGRMLQAHGFLRSIFEVFERYKTPIDMITTSEVAVSLTIDDVSHLDEIVKELQAYASSVEIDREQTIICIVGDFLADKYGYALTIFESLKHIPIRMISYGGSRNNISLLVSSTLKKAALNDLNKGIFNKDK